MAANEHQKQDHLVRCEPLSSGKPIGHTISRLGGGNHVWPARTVSVLQQQRYFVLSVATGPGQVHTSIE
jgi:hypothetical protein